MYDVITMMRYKRESVKKDTPTILFDGITMMRNKRDC